MNRIYGIFNKIRKRHPIRPTTRNGPEEYRHT
jgi:hypothetical protein